MDFIETVLVSGYGRCFLVSRSVVLSDLDYQYESTEDCITCDERYDIYSNEDGDYFAVKEGEQ